MTIPDTISYPLVGICWVIDTSSRKTRLISSTCTLADAEPYGDFLVYGPGHYEIWEKWRKKTNPEMLTRIIARQWEYEDWPRGRVLFDKMNDRFLVYADPKLMHPETLTYIQNHFRLPEMRLMIDGDHHYQSRNTPGRLQL